jgi:uncharacterized protein (DUF58 family)
VVQGFAFAVAFPLHPIRESEAKFSVTVSAMLSALKALSQRIDREAWVRFFVAIFGLSFAFASAILSTAAREAGNIITSSILASVALLLAGVVAITTVPYLAKRVAVARVREALNYDVTREGIVYLATTVVIAIAALNTGNNLLFLVVAAMLAAILVSGIVSAIVLLSLEVELEVPQRLFAGQSYLAYVLLRNRRRFVPALSINVRPPRDKGLREKWGWQQSEFVFPAPKSGRKAWVRWPDYKLMRITPPLPTEAILTNAIYFSYVAGGSTVKAEQELHFRRRGLYQQSGLGLSTRFPFSFLEKTRTVSLARELLVYPSVEMMDELFHVLPLITGEFESYLRGRGTDLYRIRDYQPDDSARHVDWKSTARSGTMKVREFTREEERRLRIVFDNCAPGTVDAETYERAISLAATLAWHFESEHTDISFVGDGFAGYKGVYDFLEYLALLEPKAGASVIDSLPVTDDYNVVLTARTRGSIPTSLWQSSYVIFIHEAK